MNATDYFFGLIAMTTLLFMIALLLPKFQKTHTLSDLHHLCQMVLGDEFKVTQSDRFITLSKHNQKVALLTLDKTLSNHSRKMGDGIVINFKKLPSKQLLEKTLLKEKIIHLN